MGGGKEGLVICDPCPDFHPSALAANHSRRRGSGSLREDPPGSFKPDAASNGDSSKAKVTLDQEEEEEGGRVGVNHHRGRRSRWSLSAKVIFSTLTVGIGLSAFSLICMLYGGGLPRQIGGRDRNVGNTNNSGGMTDGRNQKGLTPSWDLSAEPLVSVPPSTESRHNSLSHKALTQVTPPSGTYNYSLSTTEVYGLSACPFVGPFAHIRPLLDYSYHAYYSEERQRVQDRIIMFLLQYHHSDDEKDLAPFSRALPQDTGDGCSLGYKRRGPWVVFTAGPMGAGKSHSLKWMARRGYFPLDKFVHVRCHGMVAWIYVVIIL